MKRTVWASLAAAGLMAAGGAYVLAASSATFIITPTSPAFPPGSANVIGVPLDAAPGYASGSIASDGSSTKSEMYLTPESLFGGREITVGEIESISYWTKKGTTHVADARDWFLNIYTKMYPGQTTSFYGARIGTEPYFSENLADPVNTWNQWSTDDGPNQLRFFESTYGYFGGYADPHWADFAAGSSLAGSHGSSVPYTAQPILYFSIQTASAWAAGFTGQVDGLRIELTDGSVANVNFEPFLTATDRDACKKNGWTALFRADGTAFKNQGDCVSYVNTGK